MQIDIHMTHFVGEEASDTGNAQVDFSNARVINKETLFNKRS